MATSENISALIAEHLVCGDLIGQCGKFRPLRCSGYLHHRFKRYIAEIRTCSCVVVYRRFIAQCRLRSVGFTTSCKNISSENLRGEKFKRGASEAQRSAPLSAARQEIRTKDKGCCRAMSCLLSI